MEEGRRGAVESAVEEGVEYWWVLDKGKARDVWRYEVTLAVWLNGWYPGAGGEWMYWDTAWLVAHRGEAGALAELSRALRQRHLSRTNPLRSPRSARDVAAVYEGVLAHLSRRSSSRAKKPESPSRPAAHASRPHCSRESSDKELSTVMQDHVVSTRTRVRTGHRQNEPSGSGRKAGSRPQWAIAQ